jgi:hypothetical protein
MKEPTKTMHIYFICKFQKAKRRKQPQTTKIKQLRAEKDENYKLSILEFMILDNFEEFWRTTVQRHD